jgi:hypothetical protein
MMIVDCGNGEPILLLEGNAGDFVATLWAGPVEKAAMMGMDRWMDGDGRDGTNGVE